MQADGIVDSHPFDIPQIANSLPANAEQSSYDARRPSTQYNIPASASMMGPSSYQYNQHMPQYVQQSHDSRNFARPPQQQHYHPQHVMPQATQYHHANRPQPPPMQSQSQYPHVDPYAYGMNQPAYSPADMRFPQPQFPVGYGPPGGYADTGKLVTWPIGRATTDSVLAGQYARRASVEPATVPSFPRGPPRKPKQSGHALWVGNLPPAANGKVAWSGQRVSLTY